ncbi:MAG: GDSL-type esterase/lipase family protein [Betaproteobacteria bacterium]|nr:GDSL-type esterase/lipase family protein [Betaproteobacteria bacterium]
MSGRARGLRFLLLALALVAGCGDSVPQLPRLGANDVVVAFGNSLTYGTGAREQESYPAVLAQLIGRPVVRAGVPGEVTAQGLRRLLSVIDEHQPRLVIVCLGGNDMLRRIGDGEIKRNLGDMLKVLNKRGIGAVLVGVPKPALVTSAPGFYAELAREFGVPYEGKIVTSVLYAADMKADPIHPNAKGYRRMAEALAELLKQAGAI